MLNDWNWMNVNEVTRKKYKNCLSAGTASRKLQDISLMYFIWRVQSWWALQDLFSSNYLAINVYCMSAVYWALLLWHFPLRGRGGKGWQTLNEQIYFLGVMSVTRYIQCCQSTEWCELACGVGDRQWEQGRLFEETTAQKHTSRRLLSQVELWGKKRSKQRIWHMWEPSVVLLLNPSSCAWYTMRPNKR